MHARPIGSARITVALCLLGALFAAAPRALAQPPAPTGLRGRVTDKRTGKPIEAAPVLVQGGGKSESTFTDGRGQFQILLPPGTYVVRSYYDLFHGARVSGVRLGEGQVLEVNIALTRIDEERDVTVEEIEIPYRADTTTAAAQ